METLKEAHLKDFAYDNIKLDYGFFEGTLAFNLKSLGTMISLNNPANSINTHDTRYVLRIYPEMLSSESIDRNITYYPRPIYGLYELFLTEEGAKSFLSNSRRIYARKLRDWLETVLPEIKAQLKNLEQLRNNKKSTELIGELNPEPNPEPSLEIHSFSKIVPINATLVVFSENKKLNSITVSSKDIASVFGKRHDNICRDIRRVPEDTFKASNFEPITYIDSSNRSQPAYNVTRHGFNMIIKSVGKKDIYESKKLFMSAFDEAEEAFRQYKETVKSNKAVESSNEIVINAVPVVFKEEANAIYVSSRDVASVFEKNHRDILRIIKDLPADEFNQRSFTLVNYVDKKGELRPEYHLTRDGFSLLVMGFTGRKAYEWKKSFIQAFNKMEQALKYNISLINSGETLKMQIALEEAKAEQEKAKAEQEKAKAKQEKAKAKQEEAKARQEEARLERLKLEKNVL